MNDDQLAKGSERALLRRLVGYLRPYRRLVALAIVLLVVHSLLGVAGPFLTKVAVDHAVRPTPADETFLSEWLPEGRAESLLGLTLLYLGVLTLSFGVQAWQIQAMNHVGQRVMYDLRRELFAKLQALPVRYFDRTPLGRLVTRVTNDVDNLNEMFTSGVVAVAGDLLTLAFIFGVMLWLSPLLTAAIAGVAPLVLIVSLIFRKRARSSFRAVRAAIAKINAFLAEHLAGIGVVQLFTGEGRAQQEFARLNEEHRQANLDAVRAHALFFPTIEWLSALALAALLVSGGWLVEQGTLTLGVVIAFLQYAGRLFRPIQDLSEKFNILQSAFSSAERIFGLLDEPAEAPEEEPAEDAELPARVEFRGVWFAYNNEDWVLCDVSFVAEAGETLAVVGHTGAGKSTLINLLLRFYQPQKGEILVGGREIRQWPREALRRQFGVVLQDPHLFFGSIADNIALGGVDRFEVEAAARTVGLHRFIERLPQGYASEVGERGASLSTGQKQLVGFARALARKPRFLILDEATSSVDPETERQIRDALLRMLTRRTSIVIAHRLSTIQHAERVLVLHKGRVREVGRHAELLAMRGLYWKLYQLQFRDQERPPSVEASRLAGQRLDGFASSGEEPPARRTL